MASRDIVVIGASAGGVTALLELASGLPRELPAALFVVLHSAPDGPGLLADVVGHAGPIEARHPEDGERIRHGCFYIAPPDRHLLVDDGVVRVTRGPRENGFRPAVDPLFRSAARSHGARVVGVVLSGALDDGSDGLQIVKRHGGVAIAQHADDALVPMMPLAAMQAVDVDHVVPVREMAAVITRLATEPLEEGTHPMSRRGAKHDPTMDPPSLHEETPPGPLSPYTCPECGGALWEKHDGKLVSFSCHVGHRFTAEALMKAQDGNIETAMWTALRALEEKTKLRRTMAERARSARLELVARRYDVHAAESDAQAAILRNVLVDGDEPPRRSVKRRPVSRRRSTAKRAAHRR